MLSVDIRKRLGKLPAGASNEASVSSVEPEEFVLDVRFDAPPGVTILFGASGAGKSVTLKSIAGLVRPDAGRIAVNDCVLFDSESSVNLPIRERGAGYVFQNLALFPHLSALGNVEFALSGLPRREGRGRALELLEQFGIRHAAMRRPREISGGEAQRVALARALASNPRFLLLDEPLSALDEATKFGIISDLKNINRRFQLPVIYVTHSREEAVMLGERAILYERGRVVAVGEPLKVFATPLNKSVARLSGVENVFRCRVVGNDETAGTLTLEIDEDGAAGACRIDAPFGNYAAGERVTLAVRSGDILLATEEPRSTSARNILRGRITAMEERSGHIRVHVTSGANWIVSVTRQAAAELQLSNEMEIWLAFKTFSCHLLDG